MIDIIAFPGRDDDAGAPRSGAGRTPHGVAGRRAEYGLADVARPLGLIDFAIRTIIEKLRLLAEHDGMPLPRTPRSRSPMRSGA